MNKRKSIFVLVILAIAALTAIAMYWYNKPRNSLADAEPAFTISAAELYSAFKENEQEANQKYAGKIILVNGIAENVSESDSAISILLSAGNEMGGINCQLNTGDKIKKLPARGANIRIKGRCTGFLLDVNLVDAVLQQ